MKAEVCLIYVGRDFRQKQTLPKQLAATKHLTTDGLRTGTHQYRWPKTLIFYSPSFIRWVRSHHDS